MIVIISSLIFNRMKRLSLNRNKKDGPKQPQQQKISSFFDAFRTPEAKKADKKDDKKDNEIIENTPPAPEENLKRRKLFKLKKQTSKVGLFVASTTSLLGGNLDRKATKVHSPPKSCELGKKRPLTTPE